MSEQAQDPLFGYFSAMAGADQQIDPSELQQCLTSLKVHGGDKPFSLTTCRLMIAMLDRDQSGKMGFAEFKEMFSVLNRWKKLFVEHERDGSGAIDAQELQATFASQGLELAPHTLEMLVKRYGQDGQIGFDRFVGCNLTVRILTVQFQQRDPEHTGQVTFSYEQFLQAALLVA